MNICNNLIQIKIKLQRALRQFLSEASRIEIVVIEHAQNNLKEPIEIMINKIIV